MRLLLYLVDNPPNMRIKAKAFGISQPLGAGYIAAVLRQDGHEVRILDSSVSVLSQEQFKKYILDYAPDMMGFTAFTFSVKQCLEKAREVKEVNPRIKIIFGGPHATYLGEEIMADRCVDMVVRGEGEQTMREIARAFSSGSTFAQVKGLLYKDGEGRILRNPDRELADDLDAIPFPAYDLMDMNKYYSSVNRRFTNRGFAGIITARGCPYLCTFCSHKMFGRKPRLRSPENVVDEIELLAGRYGVGEFIFLDDTFTIDLARAFKICELIQKRGLKITWTCNTRADHASKELYAALRLAGCRSLHIGAEAASQEMLDSMKKGVTIAQIENAVRLAKEHVGHVVCGFIFGMPGDTAEKARATIKFAQKLNPDYATFNIATPVPGSQIYDEVVERGLINTASAKWEDYLELFSPSLPVLEMSEIKRRELVKLVKLAFRKFYFRPAYILRRIRKLTSIKEILGYARGLEAILNYQLHFILTQPKQARLPRIW